jgi:hypothetical protein
MTGGEVGIRTGEMGNFRLAVTDPPGREAEDLLRMASSTDFQAGAL